jgi:GT2 family glycosyltransferase
MAGERVTIGVPVYRGEAFLEETLHSIQEQTHRDFEVLISFDEPNTACEAICAKFLTDSRFSLSFRPERLGWVGNMNWLLTQVETDFWYYHQQDDLVAPNYLEVLLAHARGNPEAALVYCDLVPMGRIQEPFVQPAPVRGATAFMRVMTMLHEHFPAFAFRGLTRVAALRQAKGVPTNEVTNFGVDICWLTAVARFGELHHVPQPLYRKRYHSSNTESKWWGWERETRLEAWSVHCVNMLEQAMQIEATTQEMRLLWLAAVERLTSPQAAGHFLNLAELTRENRIALFDRFFEQAYVSKRIDVPNLLEAEWEEIRDWARGFYWVPGEAPFEITAFGPNPVRAGEAFNVQPDGVSAIWVRLSRHAEPGVKLRMDDIVLETVARGPVLTAVVPPAVFQEAGAKALGVIGPNGHPRSEPVTFQVLPRA